jgi:hypothetical protein
VPDNTDATPDTQATPSVDANKPCGLVLTLAGAPLTPHTVVGFRGQYRPDRPTPIGGDGQVTVDEANAAIAAGAPLELVNIAKTKLDELQQLANEDLAAARTGAVQARQDGPVGGETGVLSDHADAVKG